MQMNIWMGRDEATWFIPPFSPLRWIYSDCYERLCKWLGMSNEGQWGESRSAVTSGIIWSWAVEEVELELLKLILMPELSLLIEARYPSQRSWAAESSCSALFGQKMQDLHANCSTCTTAEHALSRAWQSGRKLSPFTTLISVYRGL